ncbi:hypothetical protein QBC37DRAFT_385054 [Rhypophila decipiens]|uniref:Zn(2)-C6 fungal-type domain-containing protein n=1 Tax=Rhypophila decipiens TaxID=261697 RepID=A0AAN7BD92_9PEZI|nr:hypothetical protein QBC37DRAFT_385054 [Rhypophila decipiens]
MDDIAGSYYNSQTGTPSRDFRPRRPHQKSKNGCNQCKNRRIKCDELKPRCTRCSKGDLLCRYPDNTSGGEPSPSGLTHNLRIAPGTGSCAPGRYYLGSYFPNYPPDQPCLSRASCPVVPPPPGPASDYSELWSHFNAHTSQTLSFEDEDLYALQVGIPGLVKDCPALAATILSVAATCSCVDIISHAAPIPGDRERVIELLGQANRHHLHSLQNMQRVIAAGGPAPHEEYDHILANAWLMAAYGTASHRLRIWLHKTQPAGQPLEEQFLPNQSGWITMFQTVHTVYTSLLRHSQESRGISPFGDFWTGEGVLTETTSTPTALADNTAPFAEEIILTAGGPMPLSRHVLFPILVSTSEDAFRALRQHGRQVSLILNNANAGAAGVSATPSHQESLSSSLSSIEILSNIVTQIQNASSSAQTISQQPHDPSCGSPLSQFGEVSPWLRRYLSRALAVTPSRSLRRLLMAFLYRVPRPFLHTIERLLDSFPLDTCLDESSSPVLDFAGSGGLIDPALTETETGTTGETNMSNQGEIDKEMLHEGTRTSQLESKNTADTQGMLDALALDVFAYWLAFTLLLDGVWFIGDVGSWELSRIVGMVKSGRLKMDSVSLESSNLEDRTGAKWWPGRIYDYAEGLKTGEAPETF